MKTLSRYLLGFLMIFSLLFSFAPQVFAEGTTMIDLSNKNPSVGDTVTMTVTGSESSTITIKYNSSVLSFSNCNVSGYSTDGNTVTFTATSGSVTFSAVASGSSNLIVSSDTLTGSSTTLSVAGESETTTEETTTEESSDTEEADTTSEDSSSDETSTESNDTTEDTSTTSETTSYDLMYGDTAYVISKRFTDSEIPAGFSESTVTVNGSEYRCVTNDVLTLLYLKLASEPAGSGSFFIYNPETSEVSELVLIGSLEDYVILQTPDSLPSDLLQETAYVGDELSFTGYQFEGISNDFYYVYGIDEETALGWYMYDSANHTISRANTDIFTLMTSSDQDTEDTQGDSSTENTSFLSKIEPRNLLAIAILVVAIVVVILINIFVARSRDDEDDEEVFDEDSEVDEQPKTVISSEEKTSKSKKTLEEIVNEADAEILEDDEEEVPEKKGFFFRRRKEEEDIWAETEDDEDDDDDDDDDNGSGSGGSSTGNHEINLMDLNNL